MTELTASTSSSLEEKKIFLEEKAYFPSSIVSTIKITSENLSSKLFSSKIS